MTRRTSTLWFGAALAASFGSAAMGQWAALPGVPDARSRAAGAIIGDTFYFMGGEATGGVRPVTCWKIQLPGGAWTPIANMPSNGVGLGGVSNVDAAALGTDIYLPGGWTGASTTNPLLRYDSTTDAWETVVSDPVPTTIHAYTAIGYQGKMYVFAGATVSGVLGTLGYIYDPAAPAGSRWSNTAALLTGRQYPASAALGGKIYVGGGIGATTATEYNTVDIYDVASNTWSAGPAMAAARGAPAMYLRGNKPYVVAGGWATYLTSGEVLNGAWSASTSCMFGLRTIAHDSNSQFIVKAGGWNGAFSNLAEYMPNSAGCYPDCDGSGNLTIADFGCFQTKFVQNDPYADCDGSGTLTIADFGCFQTKFVQGCP